MLFYFECMYVYVRVFVVTSWLGLVTYIHATVTVLTVIGLLPCLYVLYHLSFSLSNLFLSTVFNSRFFSPLQLPPSLAARINSLPSNQEQHSLLLLLTLQANLFFSQLFCRSLSRYRASFLLKDASLSIVVYRCLPTTLFSLL